MFRPMYAPPNYTTPARQKVIQAMQARRGIGAPQMPTYTNPYQFTGGVTAPANPDAMPAMPAAPPMTMQAPPIMTPQAASMPAMPTDFQSGLAGAAHAPEMTTTPGINVPRPMLGSPQPTTPPSMMSGMKNSPVEYRGASVNQPAAAQTPSTVKMQQFSGGPINYGT